MRVERVEALHREYYDKNTASKLSIYHLRGKKNEKKFERTNDLRVLRIAL